MAQAVGTIGLGTTLAGGLLSAFGAQQSGAATQQMYNYQSKVATINAQIDKPNEEFALNQGEQQAGEYGLKAAQQRGQIIANQGASGFAVGSGSNAQVVASQGKITSMDLTQIRSNAAKVAYDYGVKGTMDTTQAGLDTIAGKNARTAGDINAISSILGTAGSVSSKWLQGNTAGMWSNKSQSLGG